MLMKDEIIWLFKIFRAYLHVTWIAVVDPKTGRSTISIQDSGILIEWDALDIKRFGKAVTNADNRGGP